MRVHSMRLGLAGLVGVALCAAQARAQYDLNGEWTVHVNNADVAFQFTQSGTTVSMTESGIAWQGTIDLGTGAFSVHVTDASIAMLLSCGVINATMTPDGDHFTGDFLSAPLLCTGLHPPICQCGTLTETSSVAGTRVPPPTCGNGTLDAGEQCDDGNTVNGDCCSASCFFASAGAPCGDDGEACTRDACDGAGSCGHGPHVGCRTASKGSAISLRADAGAAGRLRWGWKDASGLTTLADLGLPTGTTAYHLCLFADDDTLLFAGDVPPGASWQTQPSGFAYKSTGSAPDGIGTLKLRAGEQRAKLLAKGEGSLVAFAGSLAVPALRAQLLRDAGPLCWESLFDQPKISQPDRFLASE